MTVEQIIKLHDLGYTKEEIEKLTGAEVKPEAPSNKSEIPPLSTPSEASAGTGASPAEPTSEVLKEMQETNKALLEQLKAMQEANIKGARQPEPDKRLTADDVIKSFITNM